MRAFTVVWIALSAALLSMLPAPYVWAWRANYISRPFVELNGRLIDTFILNPVLSPDGQKIAYEKNDGAERSYLCLVDLGPRPRALFSSKQRAIADTIPNGKPIGETVINQRRSQQTTSGYSLPLGCCFSPGSDRLAYAAIAGSGQYEIRLYHLKSGQTRTLFDQDRCYAPQWSPKSDQIAFVRVTGNQASLALLQRQSGRWKLVFTENNPRINTHDLKWSANGQSILTVAEDLKTATSHLRLFDLATRQSREIADTAHAEYPVWLSARKISYFAGNRVYTRDLKAGRSVPVADNVRPVAQGPCWRADQSELFGFNQGLMDGYESALVSIVKGRKTLLEITMTKKNKPRQRPLKNGVALLWHSRGNFLIGVGSLHTFANHLYAIYP